MPQDLLDSDPFVYSGFEISGNSLLCNYQLGQYSFTEKIVIDGSWHKHSTREAARLVYLLAGISYYKAKAPMVIDLADTPIRDGEVEFLTQYYRGGLGEYSYKNNLSLKNLTITGGSKAEPVELSAVPEAQAPLIPFGGGIDSIVTVELVRELYPDSKLFVMSPGTTRFDALEGAASVTGLEVLRAERHLDPQILASSDHGFLNGHVPVTGILSAIALTTATIFDRTAVIMSNERSASEGNLVYDGHMINHQYSKSLEFENLFRAAVQNSLGESPDYFSLLRHRNELWIANNFSKLTDYHSVFRSCNRAFHIKEEHRAKHWCGECDKCCFIDLILSPFISHEQLKQMFNGNEPLDNSELHHVFSALIATDPKFVKPFECVGDIQECRQAIALAADRGDRQGNVILSQLLEEFEPETQDSKAEFEHNISESYASPSILD